MVSIAGASIMYPTRNDLPESTHQFREHHTFFSELGVVSPELKGKRSSGRAVYLGDPRLALLGRSPVGAEKSALTTPCPIAAGSVFSGKVQSALSASKSPRFTFFT